MDACILPPDVPAKYRADIEALERRLSEIIAETEALAHIKFLEWKIRKAEDRKIWLNRGVHMPQSDHDREVDALFSRMEERFLEEQEEAQRRIEETEKNRLIEDWSAERDAIRTAESDSREALERERIAADKEIAETIARALRGDLES